MFANEEEYGERKHARTKKSHVSFFFLVSLEQVLVKQRQMEAVDYVRARIILRCSVGFRPQPAGFRYSSVTPLV